MEKTDTIICLKKRSKNINNIKKKTKKKYGEAKKKSLNKIVLTEIKA